MVSLEIRSLPTTSIDLINSSLFTLKINIIKKINDKVKDIIDFMNI